MSLASQQKGHGEFTMVWLMKNCPSLLLFHMESTHGAHQAIVFTSSLAMLANREVNLEFLDHCLSIPSKEWAHPLEEFIYSTLFGWYGWAVSTTCHCVLQILHDAIAFVGRQYSQTCTIQLGSGINEKVTRYFPQNSVEDCLTVSSYCLSDVYDGHFWQSTWTISDI